MKRLHVGYHFRLGAGACSKAIAREVNVAADSKVVWPASLTGRRGESASTGVKASTLPQRSFQTYRHEDHTRAPAGDSFGIESSQGEAAGPERCVYLHKLLFMGLMSCNLAFVGYKIPAIENLGITRVRCGLHSEVVLCSAW